MRKYSQIKVNGRAMSCRSIIFDFSPRAIHMYPPSTAAHYAWWSSATAHKSVLTWANIVYQHIIEIGFLFVGFTVHEMMRAPFTLQRW